MIKLPDEDWEKLNAYHDGELAPADAARIEERLSDEPDLAAAYQKLCDVAGALGAMQAASWTPKPAPSRWGWLTGGALAASLMGAAILGTGMFREPNPVEIHQSLLASAAPADHEEMVAWASSSPSDFPELGAAGLVPISTREISGGEAVHYVGRSGCRLTYFRGREMSMEQPSEVAQVSLWMTSDGIQHGVVASGMDSEKFAAISAYLQSVTETDADRDLYAALKEKTASAARCMS